MLLIKFKIIGNVRRKKIIWRIIQLSGLNGVAQKKESKKEKKSRVERYLI